MLIDDKTSNLEVMRMFKEIDREKKKHIYIEWYAENWALDFDLFVSDILSLMFKSRWEKKKYPSTFQMDNHLNNLDNK